MRRSADELSMASGTLWKGSGSFTSQPGGRTGTKLLPLRHLLLSPLLQLRHLLLTPLLHLPHLVLHLILSLARIESCARPSR